MLLPGEQGNHTQASLQGPTPRHSPFEYLVRQPLYLLATLIKALGYSLTSNQVVRILTQPQSATQMLLRDVHYTCMGVSNQKA